EREAADARAERGQREGGAAELVRHLEAATSRALDQLAVRAQVLAHDRSVDHVARPQPSSAGRDRLADLDRPLGDRLALDLLATRALDRAGHAGPHPEMVVGGVPDRVDLERRDVAFCDVELEHDARRLEQDQSSGALAMASLAWSARPASIFSLSASKRVVIGAPAMRK